ncbi:MAG: S-layer homology domain-containing protein, partial [Armatimonadetes bacterium]|nr:S-layer homology domain-containing protein [Armatimonadota bacterium]
LRPLCAAPSIETLDLTVGQRLDVPVAGVDRISVSDDRVVKVALAGQANLSVTGQGAGNALVTVNAEGGRRTFVVRVKPGSPLGPEAPPARDSAADPAAATYFGPPRPQAGLEVLTRADKARAIPDDLVTYTVVCRNLGPGDESKIVVESQVPHGLVMVPEGATPGAEVEPQQRRITWRVAALPAQQQSSFTFRARLAVEAGTRVEAVSSVQSATMPRPRTGEPAAVEVVTEPLLATFAAPDVIVAPPTGRKAIIDVDTLPGQRMVERLEGLGVLSGYPDGTFRSATAVTRAEATKMIVAVQQLAGLRDKSNLAVALSRPATVDVRIENSRHDVVRTVAEGWALPQGSHQLVWDGKDDKAQPVPMGVYRYEVRAVDQNGLEQRLDGTIHVVSVRPMPEGLRATFTDVPAGAWFAPYVAAAEERGVVKGYPGGQFRPNTPIRRVENTVLVVRAAGLEGDAQKRMNEALGFDDAADVPQWAVGYVAVATKNGPTAEGKLLIGYTDNRFLPAQNLSRAEAGAILERLVDREGNGDVTASGRVARGHAVSINGHAVKPGDNGRFREEVRLHADLDLVQVSVR